MNRKVRVLGVDISDQAMDAAIDQLRDAAFATDRTRAVFFPNAATLNLAAADPAYRHVLSSADFVFADGTGVRWAARMRGVQLRANLNGTDVIPALLQAAPALRIYLLGGDEAVNAAAAEAVRKDHPNVTVVGRYHGYFDLSDSSEVIGRINAADPDVLLVGFGNPLQESWIYRNRGALQAPLVAGVGGLFGFWAGTRTRAAGFTRRIGMEWFDILIREPHKARRYLLGNPVFLFRALRSRRRDLRGDSH